MIEAWLDVMMPWWRDAIAFYQQHWGIILPLLVAWVAVARFGQRAADDARRAIARRVRELGPRAQRLGGAQLAKDFVATVDEVAGRHRWMPGAGGFWVRRCETDALAALVGATPEGAARLRDQILADTAGAPRVRRLRHA